jgi:DNA-binding response OmpR family regulator
VNVKKILIIDDEPDILDAVQMVLEGEGYDVEIAMQADEILSRSSNFPDLILLDVLLSGQDGREITKQLKSQEKSKHIPILMMSAHSTAQNNIKEYKADAFLPKPFEIDQLLKEIKALL